MVLHSKPIFFLLPPDEIRHPYENALGNLGKRIFWFTDFSSLLEAGAKSAPQTVIIDFDVLEKPIAEKLERIRAAFNTCDLVGLSSTDSAQLALLCIRSGFSDFLLKPTSPEELSFAIRKCEQRHEVLQKLEPQGTDLIRAITQISSCTTPTLVRLCALEYANLILESQGAAWVSINEETRDKPTIKCFLPKNLTEKKVFKLLPSFERLKTLIKPLLLKGSKSSTRKLVIQSKNKNEIALFWGIRGKITKKQIKAAQTLFEHSELSLLNIQKFEEIKQQTFVDDLTTLYNSRYLKFALANAVMRCKKPSDSFAVLFIDVDHFKTINDGNGHLVGSEFLIAIGKTIRNTVRNIDPVFRYGGDEFVVILHDTSTAGAFEIAERIRKHIERRVFVIRGLKLQTTVSIGVAAYPEHAKEHDTLLKLADEAMYTAKKSTRNAVFLAHGIEAPPILKSA